MLSTESVQNLAGEASPFQGGGQIQESQWVHPVAGVIKVSYRRLNKENLHRYLFYIHRRKSAIPRPSSLQQRVHHGGSLSNEGGKRMTEIFMHSDRLLMHIEPISIGYGHAAIFAKGFGSDFDAWGGLAALVFISIDHSDYPLDQFRVIACGHNV